MEALIKKLSDKAGSGVPGWVWLLGVVVALFAYWANSRLASLRRRAESLEEARKIKSLLAKSSKEREAVAQHIRGAAKVEAELKEINARIRRLDESLEDARSRVTAATSFSDL